MLIKCFMPPLSSASCPTTYLPSLPLGGRGISHDVRGGDRDDYKVYDKPCHNPRQEVRGDAGNLPSNVHLGSNLQVNRRKLKFWKIL